MLKKFLGCSLFCLVFLLTGQKTLAVGLGSTFETLQVYRSLSVALSQSYEGYEVYNNYPEIVSAELVGDSLEVSALKAGVATVYVCIKNTTDCLVTTITVTGENVLGESVPESVVGRHEVGSWLENGSEVLYVSEKGVIPVSGLDFFRKIQGQGFVLEKANDYDLQLPLLSPMELNDTRLK